MKKDICQSITEKELPIYFPPPVVNYLHFAYFLAILLSNTQHLNWFYANFIHLNYHTKKKTNALNFYMPNQFDCRSSPFMSIYKLHDKIFTMDRINILNEIIHWLDNSFYVSLYVNARSIPGNFKYHLQENSIIPVLIYGYNKNEEFFHSMNFSRNMSFIKMKIMFSDLKTAFYCTNTKELIKNTAFLSRREDARDYFIILYKPVSITINDYSLDFYVEKIIKNLILYVNGENVLKQNHEVIKMNDNYNSDYRDFLWGINTLDAIMGKKIKEYNIYHGLFEHKSIMLDRIKYLTDKKIFKTKQFADKYCEVKNAANKARMICLKNSLGEQSRQRNNSDLAKINELLQYIKLEEKRIIHDIIGNVKLSG